LIIQWLKRVNRRSSKVVSDPADDAEEAVEEAVEEVVVLAVVAVMVTKRNGSLAPNSVVS
jgi:hypothetical protein